MRVFLVAAEASGDALGANLIRALRSLYSNSKKTTTKYDRERISLSTSNNTTRCNKNSQTASPTTKISGTNTAVVRTTVQPQQEISFAGVGAPKMMSEGLVASPSASKLVFHQLSVMGSWEWIPRIPQLIKHYFTIVKAIKYFQPHVVVLIDAKGFNKRIAQKLRNQLGPKDPTKSKNIHPTIVQYVAPSIWAWKGSKKNAKEYLEYFNALLLLFPFEKSSWSEFDIACETVGSPVVENLVLQAGMASSNFSVCSVAELRRKIPPVSKALDFVKDSPRKQVVSVFFGSRNAEVNSNGPVFLKTMIDLKLAGKDILYLVPTAGQVHHLVQEWISLLPKELEIKHFVFPADRDIPLWDAIRTSDAALAVSGTIVLECSMLGVPTVVAYKGNWLSGWIAKRRAKVKYMSIPNIMADKELIREHLFQQCTAKNLTKSIIWVLENPEAAKKQTELVDEIIQNLIESCDSILPSERAAKFIFNLRNHAEDEQKLKQEDMD